MKRMRRALSLLLCLALLTGFAFAATEIVDQSPTFYVNDAANILDSDTEQDIIDANAAIENACGGQIVVVTIDFLNDLDSEEYAYEILNQWGVGDKSKNNGTVLLLVVGEAKGWVSVGAGIEDALTAGKLNTMLNDYFWDDVDAGKYDAAVRSMFGALLSWYEDYYGFDASDVAADFAQQQDYDAYASYRRAQRVKYVLFALLAVLLLVLLFARPRGPRGGGRRGGHFFFFGPWGWGSRGPRGPGGFGGAGGPPPGSRPGGSFGGDRSGGFGGMGRGGGGMGHGGGAGRR